MLPLVLVSNEIHSRNASELERIRHRCAGQFEWLIYDRPGSVSERLFPRIIGAYLSADILELSSKTELSAKMADFCDVLLKCERLEFLQVPSAGRDRPIYHELTKRGVHIGDARGVAGTTVALSAFTGMLVLARNMHIHFRKQLAREWYPIRFGPEEPAGTEGNTAVIFGVGSIGSELARLCKALSMTTIGVRRTPGQPIAHFDRIITFDERSGVLSQADWVFLACPLTPETFHLMDDDAFNTMPSHAGLINVSRGAVVDEAALLMALQQQKIRCAYLDVFETEPLPRTSPLWALDNVILTPHSAGDSKSRYSKLDTRFLENLVEWFSTRAEGNHSTA